MLPSPGNNPHPARGRKLPFAVYFAGHPAGNNPHPARGRKQLSIIIIPMLARNNPHPARGRKLPLRDLLSFFSETTHTPQGDGNPLRAFRLQKTKETTHTPQGDGNLFDVHAFLRTRKQPTPRKETETTSCVAHFRDGVETPHTPQGDGNSRGTGRMSLRAETTHTPQGDGNQISNWIAQSL